MTSELNTFAALAAARLRREHRTHGRAVWLERLTAAIVVAGLGYVLYLAAHGTTLAVADMLLRRGF